MVVLRNVQNEFRRYWYDSTLQDVSGLGLVINVKTMFIKDSYRRSYTSKTAKIHLVVKFVMYHVITTVQVAFYWARSDDTVHYKFNEKVNFCCFRYVTTSPITIFYKRFFYIYVCCFLLFTMPKLATCLQHPVTFLVKGISSDFCITLQKRYH